MTDSILSDGMLKVKHGHLSGQTCVHEVTVVLSATQGSDGMDSVLQYGDSMMFDACIACGCCSGLLPQVQQCGDVVVASIIVPYERVRVNEDGSFTPRALPVLLPNNLANDLFKAARKMGKRSYFGPFASGAKLVDNQNLCDGIYNMAHEMGAAAVACEMEGESLLKRVLKKLPSTSMSFAMVKGISDFADGKKKEANEFGTDDARQFAASTSAAEVVRHWAESTDLACVSEASQQDAPASGAWPNSAHHQQRGRVTVSVQAPAHVTTKNFVQHAENVS
eukprot:ANDGO_07475.mRNA.1 hypothetical protein